MSRSSGAGIPVRILAAFVFAGFALCSASALAATLYRWTDGEGRIHYADRPPKGFSGPVTRLEVDSTPTSTSPVPAPKASPSAPVSASPVEPDIVSKRRATRDRLQADLDRARAKLETARKALADASGPQPDERQTIQQRMDAKNPAPGPDSSSTGGMLGSGGGMYGMTQRPTCRQEKAKNGDKVTVCPALVPSEAYYDRIHRLEQAVSDAEAEVAAAEQAYRRGVD